MKSNKIITILLISLIAIKIQAQKSIESNISSKESSKRIQIGLNEGLLDIRYNYEKKIAGLSSICLTGTIASSFRYNAFDGTVSRYSLFYSERDVLKINTIPFAKIEYRYNFDKNWREKAHRHTNNFSGSYIGFNTTFRGNFIIKPPDPYIPLDISGAYCNAVIGYQNNRNKKKHFNVFIEYRIIDFTKDENLLGDRYDKFRIGLFWGWQLKK